MYKDFFLINSTQGKKSFQPDELEIDMDREKIVLLKLVLIYMTKIHAWKSHFKIL